MSSIRPIFAALMAGTAVWCAAGDLTVATPDSASVRLAVPASIWWWIVPAALSMLVPAWRRRPSLVAPALLSTLPWWPVPVPAAFLLWTGPMAWVPVGIALLLAVRAAREGPPSASDASTAVGASAVLAGVLSLAIGTATAVSIDARTPGGDEPHYLVITQSLLNDGDLRIENNHEERQYAEYFGGTIAPDFIQRGADGEIYSIHAPGVSALVLPAFAVAGYRGAQATLLLVAAVTGALIWLIGWHATGRRGAAWFAWAGTALSSTTLLQSSMVFPDGPGALVAAASAWLIVRLGRRDGPVPTSAIVAVGALLAALPWMHTRFSILSAGFGLIIAWQLASAREGRERRLLAFSAVPALAALAWFAFFWLIYGTVNPAAPYGTDSGASLAYVPGGTLALFFDQQFGLLAYSPVLVGVAYGVLASGRLGLRSPVWSVAAVIAAYTMAVTTYWMWWAGVPATPARFLTAVIPAAALPLAVAWAAAGPRLRQALGALLVVSIAISAITVGVGEGSLAWNSRNAEAQWLEWLGPVVNLPRAWPSFFWRLSPDDLSTELPFVLHVLVFVLIVTVGMLIGLRATAGRATRESGWGMGLAWALPLSLMVAASAGWALTGVGGLDPARSQLGVLTRASEGRAAWRIGAGSVGRDFNLQAIRIRSEEPGRTDTPPPWMAVTGVPAGRYDVRVTAPTASGQVAVRIGRSTTPVATMTLTAPGAHHLDLRLPAGARILIVESDEGGDGAVELTPTSLGPPVEQAARAFARYGSREVFFLSDTAYIEPSGFWLRGESATDWVIVEPSGAGQVSMVVQNGGTDNVVRVTVNGETQALELAPSERRTIPVGLAGDMPMARVRVHSEKGFRPSDVGPSEDRRYLGVWVSFEESR